MKIQTGKGTIALTTLLAIWSVSMVVSLPGLAVSPILGRLHRIFGHATDLEIQMLTSLPSLLIIPFVLLAGKLSVSRNSLHGADYLFRQRAILPFCRRNDFADRRQLHPRHRGRHGHSPFDRTGSRLFLRPAARPAARDQLGDQQRNARTGHVADRLAGNDRLALSFLGLSAARRFAAADTYSEKSALAGCDIRFRSGSFSGSRRRVRCGRSCRCFSVFRFFRRRFAFAIVRRGGRLVRF